MMVKNVKIFILLMFLSISLVSGQVIIDGASSVGKGVTITPPVPSVAGGGNVSTFLDLTDTPSSYATNAGDCVKVNIGETGLEFLDCNATGGGGGDFSFTDFTNSFNINFSAKTTDNLTQGIINFYDNRTFNQSLTDILYASIQFNYNQTIDSRFDYNMTIDASNRTFNQSLTDTLYASIQFNYNQTIGDGTGGWVNDSIQTNTSLNVNVEDGANVTANQFFGFLNFSSILNLPVIGDFFFTDFTSSFDLNFSGKDSDDLTEGIVNFFFKTDQNEQLNTTGDVVFENLNITSISCFGGDTDCGTQDGVTYLYDATQPYAVLVRDDTTTSAGNELGCIQFMSTDGGLDTVDASVEICAEADESHGSGDSGGDFEIRTKATNRNKGQSSVVRFSIDADGPATFTSSMTATTVTTTGFFTAPGGYAFGISAGIGLCFGASFEICDCGFCTP